MTKKTVNPLECGTLQDAYRKGIQMSRGELLLVDARRERNAARDERDKALAEIERLRAGLTAIGPDYLKQNRSCCECANALAEEAKALLEGKSL